MAPRNRGRARLMQRAAGRDGFAMIQPQRAMAKSPALRRAKDLREDSRERRRSADILWQTDAYELTREIGEAGYVVHLTANAVARGEFRARRIVGEDTETAPDERPQRVLSALVGPRGGQKEIKRRLALHTSIAGEFYLIGTTGYEGSHSLGILWEVLSVRELEIGADGRVTRRKDGITRKELPEDVYLARGHIQDAEFSDRADSQVRRALPALKEAAIHTQIIDSAQKSRLAAGILFIPDEMSFGVEGEDEMTDDELMDALTEEVLNHLSKPIEDRTHPAMWVPLVMRGPGDQAQNVKVIELGKPLAPEQVEMRDKAIARAMRMMDVPPEKVEGKATLSGLGGGNVADSIDDEFDDDHVVPLGEWLADFLTTAYFRPMLEAFEDMTPEQSAEWVVDFLLPDGGPDRDTDRALHEKNILSDVALVTGSGRDKADMPDAKELQRRRSWQLILANPAYAPALLPLVEGFEDLSPDILEKLTAAAAKAPAEPGAPEDQAAPGMPAPKVPAAGPVPTAPTPGPAAPAPAAPTPTPIAAPGSPIPAPGTAVTAAVLIERVAVAADFAIDRAIERGSARLTSKLSKDTDLKAKVNGASPAEMFTKVGPADMDRIAVTFEDLFGDAWTTFAATTRVWLRDWTAATYGFDQATADDLATQAVDRLTMTLNGTLAANVHRGFTRGSNGLRVSAATIEDGLAVVLGVLTT